MIVTTAITAATPTMTPIKVKAVRSLFARKLPSATRNASHKAATRSGLKAFLRREAICASDFGWAGRVPGRVSVSSGITKTGGYKTHPYSLERSACMRLLPDFLVFFDQTVANGDYAVGPRGDVVLVSYHDDRVSLTMQPLEQIHDLHAGVCIERAGGLVRKQN
jgi:hypothetical protein